VRSMQDGQNTKNGELFASAFAQEHDYVAINGVFLPNQTRKDNARIHQRLYDGSKSSVAGKYGEVEVRLDVSKVRLLTAGIAVARKQQDEWEIVVFHNAPVQKRQEEEAGFVIHVEGVDTRQGGKEMIKNVPLIGIFVNNQEAALDFYTDELGLELIQDEPYGEDARWITVSPAESGIRIVLKKAEKEYEKAMVGNSDGAPVLTLSTDDVHAAYEQLRERGVRLLGEPYRYPWGIGALLLDQDGSPILLQQELGEQ
jgi:catechol 2,3-dioxygenase-like lactoylglutathione lyase family enzyme